MNIDPNNLTDDEERALKKLKQQLDDGLISKSQYKQLHLKQRSLIKQRQNREAWRKLKPVQIVLIVGFLALFGWLMLKIVKRANTSNDEPSPFVVGSMQDSPVSPQETIIEFELTNRGVVNKTAICDISVMDEAGNILGYDHGYIFEDLPPGLTNKYRARVPIKVKSRTSAAVERASIVCKGSD